MDCDRARIIHGAGHVGGKSNGENVLCKRRRGALGYVPDLKACDNKRPKVARLLHHQRWRNCLLEFHIDQSTTHVIHSTSRVCLDRRGEHTVKWICDMKRHCVFGVRRQCGKRRDNQFHRARGLGPDPNWTDYARRGGHNLNITSIRHWTVDQVRDVNTLSFHLAIQPRGIRREKVTCLDDLIIDVCHETYSNLVTVTGC
eukprot:1767891-Rhodomonas_salina.1